MYITFIIGIFIVTFSSALFFNNGFLDEKKKNLRTNNIKKIKKFIPPDLRKSIYIRNLRGKNLNGIIEWYSKNNTCIVIEENIIKNNQKSMINKNMSLLLFSLYTSFIVYFFTLINYNKNINEKKQDTKKKYIISV
jgi:hypothetical protein